MVAGSADKKNWLIAAIVIALLGAAISIYSTSHHLEVKAKGETDAVCNINETFSCDDVALSDYSEVFGIPLGVWGLGFFLALAVLAGIGLVGGETAPEHLNAFSVMVAIGVISSIVLASISFVDIGKLCITCMGIYGCNLALAGVWFLMRNDALENFSAKNAVNGGLTAAIVVGLCVAGFSFGRGYIEPVPEQSTADNGAAGDSEDPTVPGLRFAPQNYDIPIAKTQYSGLGEDYRKGGDDARVVVHKFSDFECPACSSMASVLKALHREFGNQILIVYRNYPLDSACNGSMNRSLHPNACTAARLARCAGTIGKFWEYHDLVFASQQSLDDATLNTLAKGVGLSDAQIKSCRESDDVIAKIKEDVALGQKVGVDATPSIYINGRKYIGRRTFEELRLTIADMI